MYLPQRTCSTCALLQLSCFSASELLIVAEKHVKYDYEIREKVEGGKR
jgi:hypothetical protein